MKKFRAHIFVRVVAIFLITTLTASCAQNSKTVVSSKGEASDEDSESETGEALHLQILQKIPPYDDEKLNRYVAEIGSKITLQAKRRDIQYRFVILKDSRVYALSAPGGYIYITTGFFKFLQNDIELAAALAYEIATLQYKDPKFSKVKKIFEFLLAGGSLVAPAFGTIGVLGFVGFAVIGNVFGGPKTPEKRAIKADKKALNYLVKSGYDPQGLVDILKRMNDPNCPQRPYLYDYLQTHPISKKRLDKLDKAFSKLDLENKEFVIGREIYLESTKSVIEMVS